MSMLTKTARWGCQISLGKNLSCLLSPAILDRSCIHRRTAADFRGPPVSEESTSPSHPPPLLPLAETQMFETQDSTGPEAVQTDAAVDSLTALPENLPAQAGRYLLIGEIGRGGMGIVLRAQDADLDRPLALKVLLAHRASQSLQR